MSVIDENFEYMILDDAAYVDKSMLIAYLLSNGLGSVHVFTRPTRFGKSLNLDMLDNYFNICYAGGPDLFKGLEISRHVEFSEHRNAYPVIRLNMKGIRVDSEEDVFESLKGVVVNSFMRLKRTLDQSLLDDDTRRVIDHFAYGSPTKTEVLNSILRISLHLETIFGKAPIILMDEYDKFIQRIGDPKILESCSNILSDFMETTFKTNESRSLCVIMGVMTLSQTGLLSSLNNPLVHDLFDAETAGFFGYTEDEVKFLLEECVDDDVSREKASTRIREAYDGYVFGGLEIYNPRSVNMYIRSRDYDSTPLSYFDTKRDIKPLNDLLFNSPDYIQNEIAALREMEGSFVVKDVYPATIYADLMEDDDECNRLYSYLVMTGYMRAEVIQRLPKTYVCRLSMPSMEARMAYDSLLERVRSMRRQKSSSLLDRMYSRDAESVTEILNFMFRSNSIRDSWSHDECKMYLKDLLFHSGADAFVERELGNGYPDISIASSEHVPAVHIEITTVQEARTTDLETACGLGLRKIIDRGYSDSDPGAVFMSIGWDRKRCLVRFLE